MLPDVNHLWGSDLSFDKSGGLSLSVGPAVTQQRLYRRLMTGLGEYIWQPNYGAGYPAFVGQTVHEDTIRAIAIEQVGLETSVAKTPAPVITVSVGGVGATVYLRIVYTESSTGEAHTLNYGFGG